MDVIEDECLSKVVLGGEKLYSEKKWSYSSPLLLSAEATKSIAKALSKVSEKDIHKNYKPEIIAELCFGISLFDQDKGQFYQIINHLNECGFVRYWKRIQEIANYYMLASEQSMGMIKSWS